MLCNSNTILNFEKNGFISFINNSARNDPILNLSLQLSALWNVGVFRVFRYLLTLSTRQNMQMYAEL